MDEVKTKLLGVDYINLAQAVILLGKRDGNHSQQQYRVDFGNIGQSYDGPGVPSELVGLDFLESIEKDERFVGSKVKETLGFLTTFAWLLMDGTTKEATGIPMAGDVHRKKEFSEHYTSTSWTIPLTHFIHLKTQSKQLMSLHH